MNSNSSREEAVNSANEIEFQKIISQINQKKLAKNRQKHNLKILGDLNEGSDDGPELFIAQPSDDIPKNALTEKLTKGLQAHVQQMQKIESYFIELNEIPIQGWMPPPKENSTLSFVNDKILLLGGMGYETDKDIS